MTIDEDVTAQPVDETKKKSHGDLATDAVDGGIDVAATLLDATTVANVPAAAAAVATDVVATAAGDAVATAATETVTAVAADSSVVGTVVEGVLGVLGGLFDAT